jgi:uncharacterized surface protein with fasciclin (FAS1) repeats
MQLTSLSKAARTLGVMVLLSVMVGTSMQQSAQAQNKAPTQPAAACVPLREGEFFVELLGITFTPEQAAAYDRLERKLSEREVNRGVQTVNLIDGPPAVVFKQPGVSDKLAEEIGDAQTVMIRNKVAPFEQVRLLTQRYGQYATFYFPESGIPTPEQRASIDRDQLADEAEFRSFLTPEQRKVYAANLLRRSQLRACEKDAGQDRVSVTNRLIQSTKVVNMAASSASLTTLAQALKAAGLTETLSGKGPFTVFAPTNEAFAALPKGTLEKLLKPENLKTLQKILTYHVVSGNVLSKDLRSSQVATVEGSSVAVRVQNHKIKVNNANVVLADLKGSNGVIHVIDRVILPPNLKL